jgi:hypothetical protein
MIAHALFHVDTNAQDNTGVAVPAGTEAGKPVQPDRPLHPGGPTPSLAPNPVIAPSGAPAIPGVPNAPVQNPPHLSQEEEDKLNKKLGLNQPQTDEEKKAEKEKEKSGEKKLPEKTQGSDGRQGSGPSHDVTGQPHNEK